MAKNQIKKLIVCGKTVDLCSVSAVHENGQVIEPTYDGYVPGFFPGEHAGDYLELDIEVATGLITNWPKGLTDKQMCKDMNIPFPLKAPAEAR